VNPSEKYKTMNEKFEIYQKKEIIEDLPGKKKKGKL